MGFPWPDEKTGAIRYIETPATVWQAESVLVDEINRCKPEHQNRLFSLIQERHIQGLKLEKLRCRWAVMNHGWMCGVWSAAPVLRGRGHHSARRINRCAEKDAHPRHPPPAFRQQLAPLPFEAGIAAPRMP